MLKLLKKPKKKKTAVNNNLQRLAALILVFALSFSVAAPMQVSAAMQDVTYERVVAHGGGAIDGYETTNSLEAVELAIENGFKSIEIDLALSSDGGVIAVHDWEFQSMGLFDLENTDKVTDDEFSRLLVYGKYHTLNFDDIAEILRAYPDLKIITDTKEDNYAILKKISEKYPDVRDQLCPQIYTYGEYNTVKELGYNKIILTLYKMEYVNINELLIFATCNKYLYAVALNVSLKDNLYCRQLMNYGVVVYAHTVDEFEATLENRDAGCYGSYTDYLNPGDFDFFNSTYYPVTNITGADKKVTDLEMVGPLTFRIKSNSGAVGEYVRLKVDGEYVRVSSPAGNVSDAYPAGEQGILDSEYITKGKHNLTIEVYDASGNLIGTRDDYYIRISDKISRIASRAYEYRLTQMKDVKSFEGALAEVEGSERDILRESFIAKSQEYAYYNGGRAGEYKTGYDYLEARSNGSKTMLPLSSTASNLGFTSVNMDARMRIWMEYDGSTSTAVVGGSEVNIKNTPIALSAPLTIYCDRTYAPADVFSKITGRQAIDSDGIIIILPEGISVDLNTQGKLTKAAAYLYG